MSIKHTRPEDLSYRLQSYVYGKIHFREAYCPYFYMTCLAVIIVLPLAALRGVFHTIDKIADVTRPARYRRRDSKMARRSDKQKSVMDQFNEAFPTAAEKHAFILVHNDKFGRVTLDYPQLELYFKRLGKRQRTQLRALSNRVLDTMEYTSLSDCSCSMRSFMEDLRYDKGRKGKYAKDGMKDILDAYVAKLVDATGKSRWYRPDEWSRGTLLAIAQNVTIAAQNLTVGVFAGLVVSCVYLLGRELSQDLDTLWFLLKAIGCAAGIFILVFLVAIPAALIAEKIDLGDRILNGMETFEDCVKAIFRFFAEACAKVFGFIAGPVEWFAGHVATFVGQKYEDWCPKLIIDGDDLQENSRLDKL